MLGAKRDVRVLIVGLPCLQVDLVWLGGWDWDWSLGRAGCLLRRAGGDTKPLDGQRG